MVDDVVIGFEQALREPVVAQARDKTPAERDAWAIMTRSRNP